VASLTEIREALASSIKETLPAGDVQVSAYLLPNPSPPTVQIFPGRRTGTRRSRMALRSAS
jgi:hypothetical protein